MRQSMNKGINKYIYCMSNALTTASAPVQLDSHCHVTVKCLGMDSDEARSDGGWYSMGNYIEPIIVTTEYLEKDDKNQFVIIPEY